MARWDLHLHTTPYSDCSRMTTEAAIETAIEADLAGIVLTEHNVLRHDHDDLRRLAAERITVLVGMEVNCKEGHFLVYGLPTDANLSYDMPVDDLIDQVEEADGAIAVAHPYRWHDWQGDACRELPIHAVEVASNNTTPEAGAKARKLAEDMSVARLQNSDAHWPEVIGKWWTDLPADISNIDDLIAVLRSPPSKLRA